jgi:hypothetical protein
LAFDQGECFKEAALDRVGRKENLLSIASDVIYSGKPAMEVEVNPDTMSASEGNPHLK